MVSGVGEVFGAASGDETTRKALEAINQAQQAQQQERQKLAELKAAKKAAFDSEYDTGAVPWVPSSPSSACLAVRASFFVCVVGVVVLFAEGCVCVRVLGS